MCSKTSVGAGLKPHSLLLKSHTETTTRGFSKVYSLMSCLKKTGSLALISSLFRGFFVVCLHFFLFNTLNCHCSCFNIDFLSFSGISCYLLVFFLFNALNFLALAWVQGPAWAKRNMQSQSSLLETDWPLPGLYCCSMPRVMGQFAFCVSLFAELCSARNINDTPRGQSNCDDAEHRTWVQFQHRCCSLAPWIPAAISLSHQCCQAEHFAPPLSFLYRADEDPALPCSTPIIIFSAEHCSQQRASLSELKTNIIQS